MQRRIGFVGIILENREKVDELNKVISEHADLILARVGLPMRGDDAAAAVITLVVEATTDEMGALAGRLGKLDGISVKSALAKQREGGAAK